MERGSRAAYCIFLLEDRELKETELEMLEAFLPREERKKVQQKAGRGRRQSLLGRLLMYFALDQAGGKGATIQYTEQGKPVVSPQREEGLFISCTHTEGLIGAAAGFAPLGLDSEKIGPCRWRVARRCFAPEEQGAIAGSNDQGEAFTLFWSLRESLGKMTGEGVLNAPQAVFSLRAPFCSRKDVFSTAWAEQGKWAVALSARAPGAVSCRWVSWEELGAWLEKEATREE